MKLFFQEPKISEKLCHLKPQSVALYNSYIRRRSGVTVTHHAQTLLINMLISIRVSAVAARVPP
jgi:hypothetical protein